MITDQLMREARTAIRRGDMPLAETLLRNIRAIDPQNLWALNTLGGVLAEQGKVEAAVEALGESLRCQPDDPETLANQAALLYRLNREEEGIALARRSIALRPGDARTHMILAEALLRRGEYEAGWAEYEWRLRMPGYEQFGRKNLSQPRWDGQDISGKTISTPSRAWGT
jgi:Flp pilus assembly protein TadD